MTTTTMLIFLGIVFVIGFVWATKLIVQEILENGFYVYAVHKENQWTYRT